MHLIYIDDAKDSRLACFSAICIADDSWQTCLDHLIGMRKQLQVSDGIYVRREIHSTDFVGGRGHVAKDFVPKGARVRLFNFILSSVVMLPSVRLFNASVSRQEESRAFEWLLNRINVNMNKSGSRAILISDEGKSYDSMLRRMRRFNYIPSRFARWPGGSTAKNITIDRIIEDIVYRDSRRSLFVQMADCCAYALLRRENPIASKTKYGLDQSFYMLEPIMVKRANGRDPFGVIR